MRSGRFSLGLSRWKPIVLWNLEPAPPSEMIPQHQFLFLLAISADHPELTTLRVNFSICKGNNMFWHLPSLGKLFAPGWPCWWPWGSQFQLHSPGYTPSPYVSLRWLPRFTLFGSNARNPVWPPKFISLEQAGCPRIAVAAAEPYSWSLLLAGARRYCCPPPTAPRRPRDFHKKSLL